MMKYVRLALLGLVGAAFLAGGLLSLRSGRRDPGFLPVLMYHHFIEEEAAVDTVVSARRFREQLAALQDAGYTAVNLRQLLDYVDYGRPLPKRPILITMDDGYTSNLSLAGPILEELGMCATVFVIGINEGESTYVHTGEAMSPPRFSYEEAAPWVERGVIDVQSHTFDLHQRASYGISGRDGVLAMEGEAAEDHLQVLREDMERFRERRAGRAATELVGLAYPFGLHCREADLLMEEEGLRVTFTTQVHGNHLRVGDTDSLRLLGRLNVTDWMSGEDLVARLEELA